MIIGSGVCPCLPLAAVLYEPQLAQQDDENQHDQDQYSDCRLYGSAGSPVASGSTPPRSPPTKKGPHGSPPPSLSFPQVNSSERMKKDRSPDKGPRPFFMPFGFYRRSRRAGSHGRARGPLSQSSSRQLKGPEPLL
jgi:hypothetical protein